MIRLRTAGGMVTLGQPAALRIDRGRGTLHGIVENAIDLDGRLAAIIVDITFTQEETMNLHDVIHRLVDRRGPASDAELQEMHDAVEAHSQGLDDGAQVAAARDANAAQGLAEQFKGVSDADLTERAADGDAAAQQERARRKALAAVSPQESGQEAAVS